MSISLSEAKDALKKAILEYSPITSSTSESFQQVANGVFQSEGTVSARFRGDSFTIAPVVNLGQNYSAESLEFFVRLYHELGKVGSLNVVETASGNVFIRWTTESWSAILGVVTKYFSFLYGEKCIALQKLATINKLISNLTDDETK